MTRRAGDGAGLLAAFRAAVDNLAANVDEINALNVFPEIGRASCRERVSTIV